MSQTVINLTDNQWSILRCADDPMGYRCATGNEDRTARSLICRGLAVWDPPGTNLLLKTTEKGRKAIGR